MGRSDIGPNAEYPRLRNLFVSVVASCLLLLIGKVIISKQLSRQEFTNLSSSRRDIIPKREFRPVVEPIGMLAPTLARLEIGDYPLVDMSDRGDFLFLKSPIEAKYRQYIHTYQGKSVDSGKLPGNERWSLTKNGSIIKSLDRFPPFLGNRSGAGYFGGPYNEIRFYRRVLDDGSLISVSTSSKNKQFFRKIARDKPGQPTKIHYTSIHPLSILEIDETESIWLKESIGTKEFEHDALVRLSADSIDNFPFPPNYATVERVAVTGKSIAATFANSAAGQPIRSFLQTNSGWKELPIPKGFEFSFVQKVLKSGEILGLITDQDREKVRQVLWKGDSVSILEEVPGWPRVGQYSFVSRANRNGNILVRCVTNSGNGTFENYMLKVGL